MLSEAETLEILKEYEAVLEGHFVLSSGKHSPKYLQAAMLTRFPEVLTQLIDDSVAELKQNMTIETVLTAAIGGIPVGQQLAFLLGCRSIFAERDDHDEMVLRRNFCIANEERILLADDVITTGGSLNELRRIVKQYNGDIQGVFTLFNRSGRDHWQGLRIHSPFSIEFPVYRPSECPLCADGVETTRPGSSEPDET